jgi:hypothetical protein
VLACSDNFFICGTHIFIILYLSVAQFHKMNFFFLWLWIFDIEIVVNF